MFKNFDKAMQEANVLDDTNYISLTSQVVRVGSYLPLTTSLEIYSQGKGVRGYAYMRLRKKMTGEHGICVEMSYGLLKPHSSKSS